MPFGAATGTVASSRSGVTSAALPTPNLLIKHTAYSYRTPPSTSSSYHVRSGPALRHRSPSPKRPSWTTSHFDAPTSLRKTRFPVTGCRYPTYEVMPSDFVKY